MFSRPPPLGQSPAPCTSKHLGRHTCLLATGLAASQEVCSPGCSSLCRVSTDILAKWWDSALVHVQRGIAMQPLPACTLQASRQGEVKPLSKLASGPLACTTASLQPAGMTMRAVPKRAALEHPVMCLGDLAAGRLMTAPSLHATQLRCAQAANLSEGGISAWARTVLTAAVEGGGGTPLPGRAFGQTICPHKKIRDRGSQPAVTTGRGCPTT